eukprot:5508635-Amphidinium_carterae.1
MILAADLADENDFNPAQVDDVMTTPVAWEPIREELQGLHTVATFCRLLRNAGCRRVVVHPKTYAFNVIVSLDLLFITNPITHQEEAFLNMVDWGSGYQLIDLLVDRERSAAKGNEFAGVFSMSLGQLGCMHHTTEITSLWQNARCERAATNSSGNQAPTPPCLHSSWSTRGGLSPIQGVLGYQLELPQSFIEDDRSAMLYEGPLESMRRADELRIAATKRWAEQDSRSRLLHLALNITSPCLNSKLVRKFMSGGLRSTFALGMVHVWS